MSLFEILSMMIIGPLKLIFEIIFVFANKLTNHPGLSIVVLSLVMNFLVLPLYKRADAMQEESRDVEAKLHDGVAHIKKSFSGDERMMILQTYYRQNHYKPTDALNGSLSLLLEVPFFMAAYQFLSNLSILEGVSLGPIADLSAPDALIVIGAITVNVLPVLMTLVNVISSAIYLKGFPLKTKIQLYAMALFFLVFLYNSPSGLVFYWTMNNLFSLGKTIFYKLKNPRKVASIGASLIGFALAYFILFVYGGESIQVKAIAVVMSVVMQVPLALMAFESKLRNWLPRHEPKPNRKFFMLGALFLTVLIGLLIPSTFIAASPQEFVDINCYHNPLWYCVSTVALASGTFLVWMGVFYWLANPAGREVFDKLVWILCGIMIMNYMFFGTDLGIISAKLQYEQLMEFSAREMAINLLAILIVAIVLYLISVKWGKQAVTVLLTATIALGGMSALNMVKINNSLKNLEKLDALRNDAAPHFELSTTGNNVVVIMLDRAMGEYIPYLMQEKPELKEQFEGFTYYSNTISHGGFTNFGVPAVLGGYEYTPVEMNRRSSESLVSKHNEALKMMPVLFLEKGYNVTVFDPPYANYQWIPDLSIFDDYPEIGTYITEGEFNEKEQRQTLIENNHRNFFCFAIMKSMPLLIQPAIYNFGMYNNIEVIQNATSLQIRSGVSSAQGVNTDFMSAFLVLKNLSNMTRINNDSANTFLFMFNNTTHEPMLLQEPDYTPAEQVDNTEYDEQHQDRFVVNGKTLKMENDTQMIHYHTNMAVLLQLGEWFDYLRENNVYDNTRIILVADHGRHLGHFDELFVDNGAGESYNVEHYYPLLMVKDFGSKEFSTSEEFMTNADVPYLAVNQLIDDPVNPFTGKKITNEEKYAHDQMVILSSEWDTITNNGNTFLPSTWASVKDNLWEKSNWSFSSVETVLTEHALP